MRIVLALLLFATAARADHLDDVIQAEMAKRNIPGLSIAVVDKGKIVKAKGYGVVELGKKAPVSETTLFQAGSISKSVAALGALRLVDQGKLALDEDVNRKLAGWKVPENDFTRDEKVTVRRLLSHTAGLTVHGFPGYAASERVPTLEQVLDGQPPANTEAIRVDFVPGTQWRYSGGGYTVLQKLMTDVTGKAFPELLQMLVLEPTGMKDSSYQQPPSSARAARSATAHLEDRTVVEGRYHTYPEMAAAGLWTTPSDLVRFAVEIQKTLAGKSTRTVARDTARAMITEVKGGDGLGVFVSGSGKTQTFSHDGRDQGFDAMLMATAETDQAVAIMINTNDNSRMTRRILDEVMRTYAWPTARPLASFATVPLPKALQTGRYELGNNNLLVLAVVGGRFYTMGDGLPDEELLATSPTTFKTVDGSFEIELKGDGFTWKQGPRTGKAPYVGPLAEGLTARPDPDAGKILDALHAIGAHADSPTLTAGLRADLGRGNAFGELTRLTGLKLLDDRVVAIERHNHAVARVRLYAVEPAQRPRFVLVYLTADGQITDFDRVDE